MKIMSFTPELTCIMYLICFVMCDTLTHNSNNCIYSSYLCSSWCMYGPCVCVLMCVCLTMMEERGMVMLNSSMAVMITEGVERIKRTMKNRTLTRMHSHQQGLETLRFPL